MVKPAIHAEKSHLAQHGIQDLYDPSPTNSFTSSLPMQLLVLSLQPSRNEPHATPEHDLSLLLLAFVHAVPPSRKVLFCAGQPAKVSPILKTLSQSSPSSLPAETRPNILKII